MRRGAPGGGAGSGARRPAARSRARSKACRTPRTVRSSASFPSFRRDPRTDASRGSNAAPRAPWSAPRPMALTAIGPPPESRASASRGTSTGTAPPPAAAPGGASNASPSYTTAPPGFTEAAWRSSASRSSATRTSSRDPLARTGSAPTVRWTLLWSPRITEGYSTLAKTRSPAREQRRAYARPAVFTPSPAAPPIRMFRESLIETRP
ncbi:MAG: hypothetical protein MUC63_10915 [Planctomycetes bacterium]|nr:hypothetical protein [Planctomycetota bacterium]